VQSFQSIILLLDIANLRDEVSEMGQETHRGSCDITRAPGAFPVGCAVRVDGAANRMRLLTLGVLRAMGAAAFSIFFIY